MGNILKGFKTLPRRHRNNTILLIE